MERLRKGYALRRFLEILTVALAADFSIDLIALLTTWAFDWSLHVPFFFESILTVLLAREALSLRRGPFALFLDRSFGLKDRVHSYYSFARPGSRVPPEIRESQAAECLEGIDLGALKARLKPRVPPLLLILAPVFLWIVYSSLNTDYIPPGTVSRTAIRIISPDSWQEHQRSARERSGEEGGMAESRLEAGTGEGSDPDPGQDGRKASDLEETAEGKPGPPIPEGGQAEDTAAPTERTAGDDREVPGPHGAEGAPDSPVESQLVTEQVTEPGPNGPRDGEDSYPQRLKDPTHLLNLLPLLERDSAADMESLILRMAGQPLENYPVRYRDHINRYFEELTKWQEDRKPGSTRN